MKIFRILCLFSLLSLVYCKQISAQLLDYTTVNYPTSLCNVFNTTTVKVVSGLKHYPISGGVSYSSNALLLQTKGGNSIATTFGTAYAIEIPIRQGYKYKITVNAYKTSFDPVSAPKIEIGAIATTPDFNITNPSACGSVNQNSWSVLQGTTNTIGTATINNTTAMDYEIVPDYNPNSNKIAFTVLAHSGSTAQPTSVFIRKITIVETLATPVFTITPATLSVPCGSAVTQIFTVNNVSNTPGLIQYNWNLGSSNNGWLYNGNPAPQTFSTNTNSISLTASPSASSLSNVVVKAIQVFNTNGTTASATLTSTVFVTPPNYNFSIIGNDIVCNSSDYTIHNLPSGAIVNWSLAIEAGSVLQLQQNTPSQNQLRITNQKWYPVSTILRADISGLPCGITQSVTKQIFNDNSQSPTGTFPYYQEACYTANVYHSSLNGTINANSSPVFVNQGCMVYVTMGNLNGSSISLAPGSAVPSVWGVTTSTNYPYNTLYFSLPIGSGGIPFTFRISGNGACYEKTLLFFSYSNNARYSFLAGPNPVRNTLSIKAIKKIQVPLKDNLLMNKDDSQFIVNIYDANSNVILLSKRFNVKDLELQLNTMSLKRGYYLLQIIEGKQIQNFKFYKE